jgi:hypothetical protein
MAIIQLRGLSPIDAERAIARIWYVLEQRDIESPRIEICRDSGDRIDIRIAFVAQRDADITLEALKRSWSLVAQVPAGTQKSR